MEKSLDNAENIMKEVLTEKEKPLFKDGIIPDFGEETLIFKNGEIKINNLPVLAKFDYAKLSEEKKSVFLKEKARQMTAKLAADTFIKYCKDFGLTVEEMGLALRYSEHEHQSQVKKALYNTIISD